MSTELLTKFLTLLFGYAMPAMECFKAIEQRPGRADQLRFWCQYWIILILLLMFDEIAGVIISKIPMYYELKVAFLVYLWYPKTKVLLGNGHRVRDLPPAAGDAVPAQHRGQATVPARQRRRHPRLLPQELHREGLRALPPSARLRPVAGVQRVKNTEILLVRRGTGGEAKLPR